MILTNTCFERQKFTIDMNNNNTFGSFKQHARILGIFIFTVLKSMGKAPLVQKNHPFLEESKHHDF